MMRSYSPLRFVFELDFCSCFALARSFSVVSVRCFGLCLSWAVRGDSVVLVWMNLLDLCFLCWVFLVGTLKCPVLGWLVLVVCLSFVFVLVSWCCCWSCLCLHCFLCFVFDVVDQVSFVSGCFVFVLGCWVRDCFCCLVWVC